jgi:hypothetical protein
MLFDHPAKERQEREEFDGDRVAHEQIYIMDGWEPAAWRGQWRAETNADPTPPP